MKLSSVIIYSAQSLGGKVRGISVSWGDVGDTEKEKLTQIIKDRSKDGFFHSSIYVHHVLS